MERLKHYAIIATFFKKTALKKFVLPILGAGS